MHPVYRSVDALGHPHAIGCRPGTGVALCSSVEKIPFGAIQEGIDAFRQILILEQRRARIRGIGALEEHLRVARDAGQRRVHLVGHARGDAADRGEAFGLRQLLMELPLTVELPGHLLGEHVHTRGEAVEFVLPVAHEGAPGEVVRGDGDHHLDDVLETRGVGWPDRVVRRHRETDGRW